MTAERPVAAGAGRIASLDQFRGFTVWSMIAVNFLGGFDACPDVLKHHNTYCSLADTVMPGFLLAVGFAFRLTFGQRELQQGRGAAYGRIAWRLAGLTLIAILLYTPSELASSWNDLRQIGFGGVLYELIKRDWFQTLLHIAATMLWLLPVIRCSLQTIVGWGVGSALLHLVLSEAGYFHWVFAEPPSIDGGPLGFLTWTLPAMTGIVACDWVTSYHRAARPESAWRTEWLRQLRWAALAMLVGWGLSWGTRFYDPMPLVKPADAAVPPAPVVVPEGVARDPVWPSLQRRQAWQERVAQEGWRAVVAEWPLIPPPEPVPPSAINPAGIAAREKNYWMMSQRAGTLSYLVFASGWAWAVYLLFHWLTDRRGWVVAPLTTFGTNALAVYILHDWVGRAVGAWAPSDAPGWYVTIITVIYFAICYRLIRWLEQRGIYVRI